MSKKGKKDKFSVDITTLGFQILGFFIGLVFGSGVVVLIINIVRILFEPKGI